MERRESERWPTSFAASLSVLAEPLFQVDVVLENFSGRGACIRSPKELTPGTPVKVDVEDCLLLGEVVHCQQDGAVWIAGVIFDQELAHLRSVRALMRTLLRTETPENKLTLH